MILGVQIIGMLFAFFMVYYTFLHYKRKEITFKECSAWILLWVLFLIVALFPQILDPIVKSLSLARTMDFFIILGFMFLIGALFYTYTIVRINQNKLEEIVRKIAIERRKK